MKTIALSVLLALIVFASSAHAEDGADCAASGGLSFICGPQNAEDLVLVPETEWVLSSAMGADGGFYLIDSQKKTWRQVYSVEPARVRHDTSAFASCPGPPAAQDFVSHGLHIRRGSQGHSTLYVVVHGARETIEVFDVDANTPDPTLTWVGCVPMPEGLAANSVASFRDGSLVVTVLMHPGDSFEKMFAGETTGAIYEWSPGEHGFTLMAGTRLPGNNGIEVSSDEKEIFVASTGLRTIVAFSRSNPSTLLRSSRVLEFVPDNVHWTTDGSLLTAGTISDQEGCIALGTKNVGIEDFASCPRGFIAATFDPNTLADTNIAQAPANAPFSNVTMAVEVGDELWLGTFSGDRIGIALKQVVE